MGLNMNVTLLKWFLLAAVISVQFSTSEALFEGIYCGKENCYDVLGVTRETGKQEISKKYRALARKFHPDMHRTPESKAEAETRFKEIATAYEILKDDEARLDYDYMLDNPEDYYRNYYRYYRNRVAPKVDVRIVLIVTISVISAFQYYSANQRYEIAINYFMQQPKYRNRALDVARERGTYDENPNPKKGGKKKNKQEIKEETERIIRKVLEENMDIRGGYAKPKISDILWIQLVLLPYTISLYFLWYATWVWRFNIKKEPYGEEQKLYLIRKHMKLGQYQFDAVEEADKKDYLKKGLWVKENYDLWHQEKEEEMKKVLAESAKHKAYRRYLKVHGEGRMTFDDS
ncbi:hypothetical protein FOCC_FOCC007498 [Frankliniella occidentalis]|uniref:DnaJ homolog subfamily C member 25 homolog n=1 Tax=Frankliniella occidentalis TaxID=133901 RepID=A0A6J1TK91_FRAOC|nr:dnaJ homolog subfamily C member 25 homolog [Frankliniella occidentalis]KAE8745781.1 hypothetical protein FOCC_FOCC007498 [Frankliniella occidentalis]